LNRDGVSLVRLRTRVISLITAEVVLTLVRSGLSGSRGSNEPLFHSPQSDSGSSDGSRSRVGPGMPSSANAVKVNGSAQFSPGAVTKVASGVCPVSFPEEYVKR
jgi:hypothetical protein